MRAPTISATARYAIFQSPVGRAQEKQIPRKREREGEGGRGGGRKEAAIFAISRKMQFLFYPADDE